MRRFLGMFLVPLVLAPSSAVAHSSRVETNPPDGATLEALPADATVTFDEAPKTADVVLAGPDGKVDKLTTQVAGSTIKAQLPANGPRGAYTLSYRVVSADGHPVSGSTRFTVTTGTAPAITQRKPTPPPSSSSKGVGRARERSDLVPVALGLAVLGIIGAVLVARSMRR